MKRSTTRAAAPAPAPGASPPRRWNDARVMGAAVSVLAALVYLNALANGLVWDDPIVLTRQLLAFRSPLDLIFLPRNIPQFSPDYYRPLTIVTYLIDRAIAGSSPFMFHLSVVVCHVITTYLVFRFGLVLFRHCERPVPAAGLAAALFAVHPIHTESVAWGAGRSDVLACAFVLAGGIVYFRGRGNGLAAAALVFAGTLAKETAVVFFVLLPFSDLLFARPVAVLASNPSRSERRRSAAKAEPAAPPWLSWLPFAAGLVIYFALRQAALGGIVGPAGEGSADVPSKMLAAVGLYISKLVLPLRQCAFISDLPTGPLALAVIGVLTVLVALAGVVLWRRGENLPVFLLLWTAAALAPSLTIVMKIPAAPVAERYLYIPSVGYCLLLAYGAVRLLSPPAHRALRVAVLAGVALMLVGGSVATVQRNAVWRTNLTLWGDTAAKNVTNGLPMRSLAAAYQQGGDPAKASASFQQALMRRNDTAGLVTIHNNLGSLAMVAGNLDQAEREYRAALALVPQAADSVFNLALISLTRAKEDAGGYDEAWKQAEAQKARQLFEQAQRLSPLDPDIPLALGETLRLLGDTAAARAQYERALSLGLPPANETAVRNLIAELP